MPMKIQEMVDSYINNEQNSDKMPIARLPRFS